LLRLITFIPVLILIPFLSWGLGENIKNSKDNIKEKIQDKAEGVHSQNNNPSVSSANKELIHQFKNNFTSIEDLEEALTSAVKEQGKEKLIEDIQTTIEKKVIVAENLYKKLNENDLEEIANLLIAIRVLDKTSYLHLFDVKSQFAIRVLDKTSYLHLFDVKSQLHKAVDRAVDIYCEITSQKIFLPGAPQITIYQTICE